MLYDVSSCFFASGCVGQFVWEFLRLLEGNNKVFIGALTVELWWAIIILREAGIFHGLIFEGNLAKVYNAAFEQKKEDSHCLEGTKLPYNYRLREGLVLEV